MSDVDQDTLRLTPSNTRSAILFFAMVVWLGIGFSRYLAVGGLIWIALSLVGLAGALVYVLMLLPNSSYLEASPEALTICTAFRKRTHPWQEITSVKVDSLLTKTVVKVELRVPADSNGAGDGADSPKTKYLDETLPDTYGLEPQELADRLNAYRRRYA